MTETGNRFVVGTPSDLDGAPAVARETFRYWAGLAGDRDIPLSTQIDVLELPRGWIPNLLLVDVTHDPLDLRYRLVGTAIVSWFGYDPTGRRVLDATRFEDTEVVYNNYATTIGERRPVYAERGAYLPDVTDHPPAIWVIFCPFQGADGRINRIMIHTQHKGNQNLFNNSDS